MPAATTPLKLSGGPTGLDLMNVGHKDLPLYVLSLRQSTDSLWGNKEKWTYFSMQAVKRKEDTLKHMKHAHPPPDKHEADIIKAHIVYITLMQKTKTIKILKDQNDFHLLLTVPPH